MTNRHWRVAKTHRMPYKLQVLFRKKATNYRALLRKLTYKNKASYDATPTSRECMFDQDRLKIITFTSGTRWQIHAGCLIFVGHRPQKSLIISGSFAKRDLQLKASSASLPPSTISQKSASNCIYSLCNDY